jgi:ribosomal protein S4
VRLSSDNFRVWATPTAVAALQQNTDRPEKPKACPEKPAHETQLGVLSPEFRISTRHALTLENKRGALMDNESEIVRLLTEIRDFEAAREQQYKNQLANHLEAAHKRSKQSARFFWVALFVIVFGAVYLAVLASRLN